MIGRVTDGARRTTTRESRRQAAAPDIPAQKRPVFPSGLKSPPQRYAVAAAPP
jgi:hypothetical protein